MALTHPGPEAVSPDFGGRAEGEALNDPAASPEIAADSAHTRREHTTTTIDNDASHDDLKNRRISRRALNAAFGAVLLAPAAVIISKKRGWGGAFEAGKTSKNTVEYQGPTRVMDLRDPGEAYIKNNDISGAVRQWFARYEYVTNAGDLPTATDMIGREVNDATTGWLRGVEAHVNDLEYLRTNVYFDATTPNDPNGQSTVLRRLDVVSVAPDAYPYDSAGNPTTLNEAVYFDTRVFYEGRMTKDGHPLTATNFDRGQGNIPQQNIHMRFLLTREVTPDGQEHTEIDLHWIGDGSKPKEQQDIPPLPAGSY